MRQAGYYWIYIDQEWKIAEYHPRWDYFTDTWGIILKEDRDIIEVDEKRIENHAEMISPTGYVDE